MRTFFCIVVSIALPPMLPAMERADVVIYGGTPAGIAAAVAVTRERASAVVIEPVCLSASHVAMCTIRMEPVYMVLGHSAGVAAVMALRSGQAVQEIDLKALAEKLRRQGQVLRYPAGG